MRILILLLFFISCANNEVIKNKFYIPKPTILIKGKIDANLALKLKEILTKKAPIILQNKELNITIDSGGGYLEITNRIIKVLLSLKSFGVKINCLALKAASGAMDILQSCDKRYIFKNSLLMQHKGFCDKKGMCPSLQTTNHIRFTNMSIRTGIPLDYLYNKMEKNDWYINPFEAKKLNIVDDIIY